MEPKHPPKKKARRSGRGTGTLNSDKKQKCNSKLTDRNIERYLKFAKRECRRLGASPIAVQMFDEARRRFLKFQRTGDLNMRRLTWSAIFVCLARLGNGASQ